jgi:hypothetical protein
VTARNTEAAADVRRIPRPPEPAARYEKVTPAYARQLLERNTHNRNVRSRHVLAMADDMRRGEFDDNGETVKIAVDGTIIDGQHRLLAIIESGVAQRMLIVSGLPMMAQETIDVGAKRTFGDVLLLRKEKNTAVLAATVRRLTLWNRGHRGPGLNSGTTTVKEMLTTLDRYPEVRDSARFANTLRAKFPVPAATIGLAHFLFSHLDQQDCDYFFAKLAEGSRLEPNDPIHVLRRTIFESNTGRHRLNDAVCTAYVIKAWNAFREGRPITLLRFKSGGVTPDKFPEPR